MIVKLLTEHHLEFLGSSESTHVKMPHCWKSHARAHLLSPAFFFLSKSGIFNIQFHILHSLNKFRLNIQRRVKCVYQIKLSSTFKLKF